MKKKFLLFGLMVLLVLNLVACAKDTKNVEAQDTNTEETQEKFVIAISQLTEHPALDDARLGFEKGLKEMGVNADIVYQNAQGDIPNTISIAQKFVKDEVDLIYAIATPAAQSAKQATEDIPVLFSAVTDPAESEIVESWENVGGNVTGTSDMAPMESQIKMFKEIDPNIKTIGILYNTGEGNSEIQIEKAKEIASKEGLEVVIIGLSNINEVPQAMESIVKKVDAMYNITDNMVASSMELISKIATENGIITVSAEDSHVKNGALIANGLSYFELGKQTAKMAKEILVDKKQVSEIPVGTAENTITTLNMDTLKALGLDANLDIFKDAQKIEK